MKKDYLVWKNVSSAYGVDRGNYYKLYKDGRIEKPDGYISDGKSWVFLGLVEKKPFGRLGKLIKREEVFKMDEKDLYYKNWKPKYRVVDLDHGTRRIWGGQ